MPLSTSMETPEEKTERKNKQGVRAFYLLMVLDLCLFVYLVFEILYAFFGK